MDGKGILNTPYTWRSFTDAAYYTVRCYSGGMYKGLMHSPYVMNMNMA